MEILYLLKIGELALKGGNRNFFEKVLKTNIRNALRGKNIKLESRIGRLYLRVPEEHARYAEKVLSSTFGLTYYSRALKAEKTVEDIREKALSVVGELLQRGGGKTFKVESRRTDKSFPLGSYELSREIGAEVLQAYPELSVDVHTPDWQLNIEVREQVYVYGPGIRVQGGLPVGTAGRGVLLLSGGIDSPVAGYLMAKRGIRLAAVYFHAYPYTSDEAKEKVVSLARIISRYTGVMQLYVVPFTEAQLRIRERAQEGEMTLHMRACMMWIAQAIAERREALSLVTGESLSQVASQTMESIRYTGNTTDLPVFRPLIGMDKEEIIEIARRIGTFETSILPFEDCCTIFSPRHPLIRPDFQKMKESFAALEIEDLLRKAAEEAEVIRVEPEEAG